MLAFLTVAPLSSPTGFNSPPEKLVTLIFGFLVLCCGVTLLQLSKVDADKLAATVGTSLDRRSTILLAASRAEVGDDGEKGMSGEEPGVDTIRGTFGVIGSIHRAISSRRSMRQEASFDPDSVARRRGRHANGESVDTSTADYGMQPVRTQLYDNPMPADASDKISLYSNHASPLPRDGNSRRGSGTAGRERAISFAAQQGDRSHDHQMAGRYYPNSADITQYPEESDPYRDPFADGSRSDLHAPPLSLTATPKLSTLLASHFSATAPLDTQLSPATKARFKIPELRSKSRDRGHRPQGPSDLDRLESQSLVHRQSEEEDEDERGRDLSRTETHEL